MKPRIPKEVSPVFNFIDADISLISSDAVEFKVHKANLSSGSRVLKDLIENSDNKSNAFQEINIKESSEVLEIILLYLYPQSVSAFDIASPNALKVIQALQKYWIWRGLDGVELAYTNQIARGKFKNQQERIETVVGFYSFAYTVDNSDLTKEALNLFLNFNPDMSEFNRLNSIENVDKFAPGSLISLKAEWSDRALLLLESHRFFTAEIVQVQAQPQTHSSDLHKHCQINLADNFKWLKLRGILCTSMMLKEKEDEPKIKCQTCTIRYFTFFDKLFAEVKRWED